MSNTKNNINEMLEEIGFKSKLGYFYYTTPIVLPNNQMLVIYLYEKDKQYYLTERMQVFDAYNSPNIDIEYLKKELRKSTTLKNLKLENFDFVAKININNTIIEMSNFIKELVIVEKIIEKILK